MRRKPTFTISQLERISEVLADSDIRSTIARLNVESHEPIPSVSNSDSKQVFDLLHDLQQETGSWTRVREFIQQALEPVNYVSQMLWFEDLRKRLNAVLVFAGLIYERNGNFKVVDPASTIDEALKIVENDAQNNEKLPDEYCSRKLHDEVLKCAADGRLAESSFRVLKDAMNALFHRIQQESGVSGDGVDLISKVFGSKNPYLAVNRLKGESDWSEQRGFCNILKGMYALIRNPIAHGIESDWKGERYAADYLSLISLMHHQLDEALTRSERSSNSRDPNR